MRNAVPFTWRSLRSLTGWSGLTAIILFLGPDSALAQCSLCRDAVAASSSQTREAMNYAIIGLAMTPYAVAALAAWTLSPAVREYVRTRLSRINPRWRGTRP